MTNFYDSLNELVSDARFRNLAVTQNFESFLGVDGINEAENMNTFSWFLNPRGSHGLQDMFLKELFTTTWTALHGDTTTRTAKGNKFYSHLSPVGIQNTSFAHTFIDRNATKEIVGADIVITDVEAKIMVVINNKYNQNVCDKVTSYFTSETYKHFENKVFVTFDGEVQSTKDTSWIYMNNEWLINLCSNIIECPQYTNHKTAGYLKDFYQFLTGAQYGTSHNYIADTASSLVTDYYEVISAMRNYKCEKVSTVSLVDVTPREFAGTYYGKISEKEYGVLNLYWAYKNTFNTFFQIAELEEVTTTLNHTVEGKNYGFNRTFIRNGLSFNATFNNIKGSKSFVNGIFNVEMVMDNNKNLNLGLVVNKNAWDRLTHVQKESVQKNFGFSKAVLTDRVMVWNRFYKQDWKKQDLGKEIIAAFEKINTSLNHTGLQVA